jgi:hypothetical protein
LNATITNGTNTISGIVAYGPASRDILYGEKFLGEYLSGTPFPSSTAKNQVIVQT